MEPCLLDGRLVCAHAVMLPALIERASLRPSTTDATAEAVGAAPAVERVLIVAPTPYFADRGCHVRIYEEACALRGRNVQTEIVTYPSGKDIKPIPVNRGWALPGLRGSPLGPSYARPFLDLDVLRAAIRVGRRLRPQIIHVHLHEGIVIGLALRKLLGVPLVADLQGSVTAEMIDHGALKSGSLAARAMARVERWLVQQPDAVVSSSTVAATLLLTQGVDSSRVQALPDGVDLDRFYPMAPDPALAKRFNLEGKLVVVFLGVLTEYQGVDALLAAVPHVIAAVPNAHFLVMGYPNEARYRARVEALNLSSAVTIPGRIPYEEAPRYLALGDLAVSAKQSLTEANGKLLNYMGCGLPVVATETPVNRYILGDDGRYAPVGNTQMLSAQLITLLRDEALRRRCGAALRRRAEELFAWPLQVERLLSVYHELSRSAAPVCCGT
jgi:glycosyltransferase involved in cell wall biosynthesis